VALEAMDEPLMDWKERALEELCSPRRELVEPSSTGANRYVGLEHIDPGSQRIRRWGNDGELRSTKSRFYVGDVLYGKLRPYLDKAALADFDGVCSTDIIPLRSHSEMADPCYLSFLLHMAAFLAHAVATTSGVNHPRTSWGDIARFSYPIPPHPEQRAIAAVLSKIQAAVEVQDKLVATLKELKAATMARLFREGIVKGLMFDTNVFDDLIDGRLNIAVLPKGTKIYATHIQMDEIARCSDQERRTRLQEVLTDSVHSQLPTASFVIGVSRLDQARLGDGNTFQNLRGSAARNTHDALIAETAIKEGLVLVTNDKDLRERARKAGGESIGMDDLLAGKLRPSKQTEIGEIPESWEVVRLGEIAELITKGSSPNWQGFDYCDSGVLFVRSQNVGPGELLLSEMAYLPEEFNRKERRSILRPGDVLINIVGASIGRAAVADSRLHGANINQAVALVRLTPNSLNPFFLMSFLLSQAGLNQMHRQKKEIARANLSLEDVGSFLVPVPSRIEQDEIATALEAVGKRLLTAEQRRDSLKSLFSSMLHLLMTGQVRVSHLELMQTARIT